MDRGLIGQRLLLVEDDLMLGESLTDVLLAHGAQVDWHKDGEHIRKALQHTAYDVLILDIGLPYVSGFDVLSRLRESGCDLPVLILSARDQVQDRVKGLNLGADDYLLKPFDLSELLARIRALGRRRQGRAQPKIDVKGVSLDPMSHQVWYQQQLINLSRQEFRLLQLLMEHADQVMTRDRLESALLDADSIESNTLEVHIHHLRKKLFPELIRTLRGVGYMVQST